MEAKYPEYNGKRNHREGGRHRQVCGSMYYTIEGKRFLCILYIMGLLTGSLLFNVCIQTHYFRAADFSGFVEYIRTLEEMDSGGFFSYVCLIRFRQILIFAVCLFLFSPYVIYCVLDFFASALMGVFISTLVLQYGWKGMIKGAVFLFPHYIFYVMLLALVYVYLFRKTPASEMYMFSRGKQSSIVKSRKVTENKIIVAAVCLLLFAAGCYGEAYLNPPVLKIFFQ